MIATVLALVTAVQAAPATPATPVTPRTPAAPAPAAKVQIFFILIYQQGPNWIAAQPMQRQRLGGHFNYMQKLVRDGVLVGGGPFVGENAGMAMIRTTDLAAARAVLAADPAITGGVFTGTVRAWEVRVGAVPVSARPGTPQP